MRIMVIIPSFLPAIGGAELVVLEVFRRLSAKHSVRLVTANLTEDFDKEHLVHEHDGKVNFEVVKFDDKVSLARLRGHKISGGLIPPFSLSAIAAVRENIEEFKPDVVNLHYVIPFGLAAVLGKRSSGVPLVVTHTGRDVPGPGVPFFWRHWNRFVADHADEVTYVAGFCRNAIFGRGSQRGVVIYNGVNLPEEPLPDRARAKERLGISKDRRMIFTLGRLSRIKRVDVLINAMGILKKEHPDLLLYIAGPGPEQGKLECLAKELGLEDSVRFLGYVPSDEIGSYFTASEFFVFHSMYETFGMVLAEAMSWGRACVAADNTAIPEVAPDGECALLARTLDAGDMAEKINMLLKDSDLCDRLGAGGMKRAAELFDWDKIALKYEDVFLRTAKTAQ